MRSFDEIYAIAEERHGAELEAKITDVPDQARLLDAPEDRWLAQFSRNVFSTGLNWSVIEKKWPDFEEAFFGFDVGKCALMDDTWFDELIQDRRIVRHGAKILSVRDNAAFFLELREEGGIAKVVAEWPREDFIGLLTMLKKRGSRLGGTIGAYSLRMMGKDSFLLSRDVVARLVAEGVVDKAPTSKAAMAQTQDAFNTWVAQSGRSMTVVSRVLALSI